MTPRPANANTPVVTALDPETVGQLIASLGAIDLVPILHTFGDDLGRLAKEHEAAVAAGDAEGARRAAHALAGTGAGIGAKRLESAARLAMVPGTQDRASQAAAIRAETDAALIEIATLARDLAAKG